MSTGVGQPEHGCRRVKASSKFAEANGVAGAEGQPWSGTEPVLGHCAARQDLPAWETWAAQDIAPGMPTSRPCPRPRENSSCHNSRLCVARARAAPAPLSGSWHLREAHVAPQSLEPVPRLPWEMIHLGRKSSCSAPAISLNPFHSSLKSPQIFQTLFRYLSSLTSCYSLSLAENNFEHLCSSTDPSASASPGIWHQ